MKGPLNFIRMRKNPQLSISRMNLYVTAAILYTFIIFFHFQFTGPWRVSNMLLEEIVRRKKLRVTIATRFYLRNREACELGTNASSLEAFCTLFLGKSKNDLSIV
jgi:hypothetical protein